MEILIGKNQEIVQYADGIRRRVFIEEQGVPEDEVFDGNADLAIHAVIMEKGVAVATSRIIKETDLWSVGLVAVEKASRGLQYGRKIMEASIDYVKKAGGTDIVLTAQSTAKKFYEKLGFAQCGEEIHFESGFVLVPMKLSLKTIGMIGQIVKVIVDRPLGSYHPEYKDLYYPINYGYIEGIIAPDGEEQDAYILGVDKAVKEFTGKVIAVIHRYDDVEEKWVVASEDLSYSQDEIMKQVHFQEQYFQSVIRM